MHTVVKQQHFSKNFLANMQMVDISPGMVAASMTRATRNLQVEFLKLKIE
jgi:hypothetical protein